MGANFEVIANAFGAFLSGNFVVYVLEAILIGIVLYNVIRVFLYNRAKSFAVYYILSIVAVTVMAYLSRIINLEIYLMMIFLSSGFFLSPFALSVMKSVGGSKILKPKSNFEGEKKTTAETEACIGAIIKAVQNLSKSDTGALIVLSNGKNFPNQVLASGTKLNADISSQLLEGIFINKAPLHDGALIIEGHKIKAAGCLLPLSQSTELSKDLGTRHRAALGIWETSNAVTIVVSEETGIISITSGGKLTRYANYTMLRNVLTDYYWAEFDNNGKNKKEG